MKKTFRYILPILMAMIMAVSYASGVYASDILDETYEEEYQEEEYADEEEYAYEEDYAYDEDTAQEDTDAAESDDEQTTTSAADAAQEAAAAVVETDENGWPVAPETKSGSVYMYEMNTGVALYEKDADEKRYPASTTKILTCLIALENCSLSETVTYSANAVDLEDGDSSIDAVEGEEMSMKDCLYGLMLPSGNDCAIAIAEHVAGSVEAFADMMNERAQELGCTGSHFVNANGLYDDDHYTTASDLCKIAQVAFNNSAFVEIVSHNTYTIPATNKSEARNLENTNYMIDPTSSYYYEYVIGGKTGYLYESGRCLVTLAKKDGLSIITVTMYCSDYTGVFTDTEELLDYAFNAFAVNNISEQESRFDYACDNAKIKLDTTAQILMPKQLTLADLDSTIDFTYDMDQEKFKEVSEEAGITSQDGRHLYAIINYSYAGNYLGKINVILDDNMEVSGVSFATVKYINAFWFILAAAVIAGLVIMFSIMIAKRPEKRRRKTRVIETQTPDGQPIPISVFKMKDKGTVIQTTATLGKTNRVRTQTKTPAKKRVKEAAAEERQGSSTRRKSSSASSDTRNHRRK